MQDSARILATTPTADLHTVALGTTEDSGGNGRGSAGVLDTSGSECEGLADARPSQAHAEYAAHFEPQEVLPQRQSPVG